MNRSKSLLAAVLMGSCLSAVAAAPHKVAYLTSWGLSDPAALDKSKVDTYMLSFGQWDAQGNITSSDGIAAIPQYDPYWMSPGLITWTNLKYKDPKRKMLLAFGGQTYEQIWSYIQTPEAREILAQNIVKLMDTEFPVYAKNLKLEQIVGECLSTTWNGSCNLDTYQKAGTVKLDGIDFDFEKEARITPEETANLLALVTRIKALAPSKIMSLTTYHVGADPLECANSAIVENCSYVENERSTHHGEVSDLLAKSKDIFNFFNVMTYDAGQNFKYQVALQNFAKAIGDKSKIVMGNTINAQWSPSGPFVETDANNIARAKWQSDNGYGGVFVWNFGASTQQLSMAAQVDKANAMFAAIGTAVTPTDPLPPVTNPPVVTPVQDLINIVPSHGQVFDIPALSKDYKKIAITTRDGAWTGEINLPATGVAEGTVVVFKRSATWATNIVSQEFGIDTPAAGETRTYTYTNGVWRADGFTISRNSQFAAIADKQDALAKYLRTPMTLTMVLSDGNWTRNIYLPVSAAEGAKVKLYRNSTYATNLYVNGQAVQIARGTNVTYQFKGGVWVPATMNMTYSEVLNALSKSPETFKQLVQHAQNINAVLEIKP